MSDKIKSKDLSYDAAVPPFLQRLKGQHTGRDADRHERPLARPRRAKDNDEEDGPVIVDENGETMTEKDIEQRNAAEKAKINAAADDDADAARVQRSDRTVTAGVVTNKRKAAKVVGDEQPDHDETDPPTAEGSKPIKKVKKKAKAIKLAFDDEDG